MLFEWSEEWLGGSEPHEQISAIVFIVFWDFVWGFFSSNTERFTSTHETLIVAQTVPLSSTSIPPEDFKVKAHIMLWIPTPGQAGDKRLAIWPGRTYQNIWNSGAESLQHWCSFSTWTPTLTVHILGFVAGTVLQTFLQNVLTFSEWKTLWCELTSGLAFSPRVPRCTPACWMW